MRGISRAGSACAATGLAAVAVIGMSPAAYADQGGMRFQGAVKNTRGDVTLKGRGTISTELMVLSTGGPQSPELLVYCIDLETQLQRNADYREGTWAESWLKDTAKVAKINWVLNHSYPKVNDLGALAKSAGFKPSKGLSAEEAVEATQAAIWHYANGADLSDWWNDDDVVKLYDYLTGKANSGDANEPGASLSLTPGTVSGKDGDTPGVGPVTVKTTGTEPVAVKLDGKPADGVQLVDKSGNPVNSAADGTELYVKVPKSQKPGEAKISATTKAGVNIGRVFLGDSRKQTQTLIAAGSQPFSTSASATVKWTHQAVPVPSAAFKEDCVEGGVAVTLKNTGDGPADFTVNGKKVTVPGDSEKREFVKVAEDTAYNVKVTGPGGFSETFADTLDCIEPGPTEPTTPPTTAPATTAPATTAPATTAPATTAPPTEAPTTKAPETSEPPTTAPATTSAPATSAPATSAPATSAPATSAAPATTSSAPATEASPSGSKPPAKPIVDGGTSPEIEVPWLPVSNSKDLAETGGNDSNTALIAGAAGALLLAGGGAVVLSRRRGRHQS
ncbi:Cys-Gln thioester bond-forming surface protein [Uniformispora flossi]|uniref:Cys-Gln thioester bond-forming surface protein n=1 Tax=Uniformispora flossi TaxID=3390723 RepID=UPI003C2F68BB